MKLSELSRFRLELALELKKFPCEIDEMDYDDFISLYKYSKEKLLGSNRIEMMLAQLTALTYNINAKKKKDIVDFLISLEDDTKEDIKKTKFETDLKNLIRASK